MGTSEFKVLRAARLFDGSARTPLVDAALLIEGQSIRALGRSAEIRPPVAAVAAVYDYGDATILPGLVDGHTHLVSPGDGTPGDEVAREDDDFLLLRASENARITLRSGVTTIRDNGSKHRVALSLRDAIRRGAVEGPRIVVCGRPVTITGGHLHYFGGEADGIDGVRSAVRRLLKEGADYLKIVASGGSTRTSHPHQPAFTPQELLAIVEEARRAGRLTAAHAIPTAAIRDCLDAGVDMIIHCSMTEGSGEYVYRPEIADAIAARGAWVNPTMHDIRAWIWHFREERERTGGKLRPADAALNEKVLRMYEAKVDAVGRLHQAGVKLMVGSDSPWGRYRPGFAWLEVDALHDAGLSPAEALRAATSGAAESIGAGDVAGCLAPGRPADVLVVAGDPLASLAALGRPLDVFQNGRIVATPTERQPTSHTGEDG